MPSRGPKGNGDDGFLIRMDRYYLARRRRHRLGYGVVVMTYAFADGTRSIVSVLRPKGPGWSELPCDKRLTVGYPGRTFYHQKSCLAVISAVEVADDGKIDKGPEYHISISKQTVLGPSRCDSNEAKWVLREFSLDGAEEDNHVPNGVVRNFWRPVAHALVGMECECKAEEPAIVEDKGDFVWRPAP